MTVTTLQDQINNSMFQGMSNMYYQVNPNVYVIK